MELAKFRQQKPALVRIAAVKETRILSNQDIERTLTRFAHQVIEPFDDPGGLVLVGIQTRGIHLARRLRDRIKSYFHLSLPVGLLDITFYRDDFRSRRGMPTVQRTEIPFDVQEKNVVLVDDVLYTGRTARSGLEAIMSFGRPADIRFCCLIDRGHRELPIQADIIGKTIPTHEHEEISVHLTEEDGEDAVYVTQKEKEKKST